MTEWIALGLALLACLLAGAALALVLAVTARLRRDLRRAAEAAQEAVALAGEAAAGNPAGADPALRAEMDELRRLLGQVAARIEAEAAAPRGARDERLRGSLPRGGAAADEDRAGPTGRSLAAAVQEAVEANRIDLYLQPLVTLPQRRARFMTVSCRLRDRDGRVLAPERAMPLVAARGLAQELDNQVLFRCVQMVRRTRNRPRSPALFCPLSAPSLADADFFAQFSEYLETEPDLPDRLVFELPFAAVAEAEEGPARRLRHLAELGFHLAVDRLDTPRFSAAELARTGISFARIDAASLLPPEGWEDEAADDEPAAADPDWLAAQAALRREGILPIASGVAAESQVPPLLDLGINLAEGPLFGLAEPAGPEP